MPGYDEKGRLLVNLGRVDRIIDADGDTYVIAAEDYLDFFAAGARYARVDANGLLVTEYLRHYDDPDTYLRFTDDRFRVVVGAVDMIDITEAAQDIIEFNAADADVDIIFNTLVADSLFISGADGVITLGAGNLKFPAVQNPSADANTLDDYEEGTWTMEISFGGGVVGITYGANTGYYTKIGNIVTISGIIILTSKGTSVGNALITGLPFTSANNLAGLTAMSLHYSKITFANQFTGYTVQNSTTASLFEITEAGVLTTLTDANFANDSQIIVNCTYRIE